MSGFHHDYFTVLEDLSVNRLLQRLKKGMRLKARIVLPLERQQYLLRLQGRNLIMQSNYHFERKQEVWVEVEQTKPKLKLLLLKQKNQKLTRTSTSLIV